MSLHYLTVQDILWINLQVTKRTQTFSFAKLEEATFYQYGYGQSSSLLSQASHFLSGFAQKKPFPLGNEATAFVATVAFLHLNGMRFKLSDDTAPHWIERAIRDPGSATTALAEVVEEDSEFHDSEASDVQSAVGEVIDSYPRTLALIGTAISPTLA